MRVSPSMELEDHAVGFFSCLGQLHTVRSRLELSLVMADTDDAIVDLDRRVGVGPDDEVREVRLRDEHEGFTEMALYSPSGVDRLLARLESGQPSSRR